MFKKYDVPFIGSDDFYYENEDGEVFIAESEQIVEENNSLINISLTKSEWMHIYHQLSWEFQVNGYVDEKLDKILNEFKKQLLIVD